MAEFGPYGAYRPRTRKVALRAACNRVAPANGYTPRIARDHIPFDTRIPRWLLKSEASAMGRIITGQPFSQRGGKQTTKRKLPTQATGGRPQLLFGRDIIPEATVQTGTFVVIELADGREFYAQPAASSGLQAMILRGLTLPVPPPAAAAGHFSDLPLEALRIDKRNVGTCGGGGHGDSRASALRVGTDFYPTGGSWSANRVVSVAQPL